MFQRKVKSTQFISITDGKWTIQTKDDFEMPKIVPKSLRTFHNLEINFRIGKEFDELTPDGRQAKTTARVEGNKLILDQKGENSVNSTVVRTFESPEQFVMTMETKGVTCTRSYGKALPSNLTTALAEVSNSRRASSPPIRATPAEAKTAGQLASENAAGTAIIVSGPEDADMAGDDAISLSMGEGDSAGSETGSAIT